MSEASSAVCDSWEQISDNAEILEAQFKKQLKIGSIDKSNQLQTEQTSAPQIKILARNPNRDALSSLPTTPRPKIVSNSVVSVPIESETEFVPPLKILSRPKEHSQHPSHQNNLSTQLTTSSDAKAQKTKKSLQQREKEYAEARMRILGDVRFLAEELEAEQESSMSPAEILKLKIDEAMRSEEGSNSKNVENGENSEKNPSEEPDDKSDKSGKKKRKKSSKSPKAKIETHLPPPKDFPLSKIESERILRQPRGPDGSPGFLERDSTK